MLAQHTESPGFKPHYHINQTWWHKSVILLLGGESRKIRRKVILGPLQTQDQPGIEKSLLQKGNYTYVVFHYVCIYDIYIHTYI